MPDGGDHLRRGLFPLRYAQARHVLYACDGMRDHRADVLHQLEFHAHAADRQHDVGEHHRGIHPQPPHRLERDLGAELGLGDDLRQRPPLAQLAVLGQRTARLAHEPDGSDIDRLAARGVEKAAHASPDRVASMTDASCATETNQASNCDGGRSTPASSME